MIDSLIFLIPERLTVVSRSVIDDAHQGYNEAVGTSSSLEKGVA